MVNAISVLGCTGSIGRQTIAAAEHIGLQVSALTAQRKIDLLEEQARRLHPKFVAVYDEEAAKLSQKLSPELLHIGRIRLYLTIASIHLGDLENAERTLYENGGLVVADIREGENIITNIYLDLEEAKAGRDGRPFDRNECDVPAIFDYRVSQRKKKRQ